MHVTVFGASGKVGRLVVKKLLAGGHEVTVFVHQSGTYQDGKQLHVIKGDIHNAALVESAVAQADAVISALGSWHTPTKDILSAAMRFAIPPLQARGSLRLISLTGSAARAPGDKKSLAEKLSHRLFTLVARDIIRDAETHLTLLTESSLDWTVLRAPIMRNGGKATYVLNQRLPGAVATVTRESVATALVDQLSDGRYSRTAPHIHQA